MKLSTYEPNAGMRFGVASLATLGLLVVLPLSAQAADQPSVGLGTDTSFAVLAGSTVTNTGPSSISGNLGASPGKAVTGLPPGLVTNGTQHKADAVALQAQTDLKTAYLDAAGRTPATAIPVELSGRTLKPGVYAGGALGLTGVLTLDAGGDPSAVFVFKAASTLITGPGSQVKLINGASSCNVFWQVTSSATLGAGSKFRGTIMALTSISLKAAASVDGRVMARNGAVTLITNTIRRSPCVVGATTKGTTPSTTTPGSQVTHVPTAPVGAGNGSTAGSQVNHVPSGALGTGDGSTSGRGRDTQALLAGALIFAGLGGAAIVTTRRRRRQNT